MRQYIWHVHEHITAHVPAHVHVLVPVRDMYMNKDIEMNMDMDKNDYRIGELDFHFSQISENSLLKGQRKL